jgi:hypothetical protein
MARTTKPIPTRLSHHSGLREVNHDSGSLVEFDAFCRRRGAIGGLPDDEARDDAAGLRSAINASSERWRTAIAVSIFAKRASNSESLDESMDLRKPTNVIGD